MRRWRRIWGRRHVQASETRAALVAALVLIALLPSACRIDEPPESIVVVSYNIRYDNPADEVNAWSERRARVAGLLSFYGADIAGLQEAEVHQIGYLEEQLPGYEWYGVGRNDGADAGEFVPIFYRTSRFERIDAGTFWLSPDPSRPGSVGWDAALTRITSWVLLRDRTAGTELFVYNTHFDHVGEEARRESARLIRDSLRTRRGGHPAVVLGDFNATPDSEVYRTMMDSTDTGAALYDVRDRSPLIYGPTYTFEGFEVGSAEPVRIDYIFVTPGVEVRRTGVLSDQIGGRYPSDHLPVLAEVVLSERP